MTPKVTKTEIVELQKSLLAEPHDVQLMIDDSTNHLLEKQIDQLKRNLSTTEKNLSGKNTENQRLQSAHIGKTMIVIKYSNTTEFLFRIIKVFL